MLSVKATHSTYVLKFDKKHLRIATDQNKLFERRDRQTVLTTNFDLSPFNFAKFVVDVTIEGSIKTLLLELTRLLLQLLKVCLR